jgi:hypothetical protein
VTYFGGLGSGKGWLKFLFLVEPEILREALAAVNPVLVITNGRVPTGYKSTPLAEYVEAYARYVNAMLESPEAASRASSSVCMGLATSLDRFVSKPCPDARFKLLEPEEPVVNLTPETLHYDETRGQLCTNVMTNLYFGMELSYPRVISLDRDKHEVLYETAGFASHAIFQKVKVDIQKVTQPCRMRSPAREHRPPIRITEGMRDAMKSHPGLKAARLEIV